MIELRDVYLSYGDRTILRGVSMVVEDGRITSILGPSGSGKSTILKLMLGLIPPTSGQVLVDGVPIQNLPEEKLFPIRKKMGMVFQGNALFDSLNVRDNLSFFLRENLQLSEAEIQRRTQEQLHFTGLESFANQLPDSLSGGMKKRLAIGRALIFGPSMVLLDEPTVGLDPVSTKKVLDVIRDLREEKGLGAVMVTHLIQDVFSLADHVIILFQGKVIYSDRPEGMYNSNHPFINSFLSDSEESIQQFS
jgi:phospholipid/cholesterol/gamma-HCH transport system ATP-binding protein